MAYGYIAVAAASLIGSYLQSEATRAAGEAAGGGYGDAVSEQRRQFNQIMKLLSPYVSAGESSLSEQLNLLGLNGNQAQEESIAKIEQSPYFEELLNQGREGILQSGSATGGLRGGNIQGALLQYRPSFLKSEIENQYAKLSGITNLGQASAAGVGAAGQATGTNISNLFSKAGENEANQILAEGSILNKLFGNLGYIGGSYLANKNDSPQYEDPGQYYPDSSYF